LAPGKGIRIAPDGTKINAFDVINIVCNGHELNDSYAKKMFSRVPAEVRDLFKRCDFGGSGSSKVRAGEYLSCCLALKSTKQEADIITPGHHHPQVPNFIFHVCLYANL